MSISFKAYESKPIKRIRDREYSEIDELKNLKIERHFVRRFMADQKIRQTTKFREVDSF